MARPESGTRQHVGFSKDTDLLAHCHLAKRLGGFIRLSYCVLLKVSIQQLRLQPWRRTSSFSEADQGGPEALSQAEDILYLSLGCNLKCEHSNTESHRARGPS